MSSDRRWWVRLRLPRRSRPAARVAGEHAINAFARQIDVRALSPEQFAELIRTLHMLGAAGAGVELSALSTEVLVDIVRKASKEQLRAVTDDDELRGVFLDELFRRMSDHFLPEKARGVDVVISWRFISGDGTGEYDRFQTLIEDGICVSSADLGRSPDTTVTLAADDFVRMATGAVAVPTMFMTGRIKVKGEYTPAVKFSSYFDIPEPT